MSKTDTSNMKIILELLSKENRPFGLNNILEKCDKNMGKATLQKLLDNLVDKDKITEKTFGKQKIYFIKQNGNLAEQRKELQNYVQRLNVSQYSVKNKQSEYRELEKELKSLSNVRSLESLEQERSTLLDEIKTLKEKIAHHEAKAATVKLTPADAKKITKRFEHVATAYRKRKRICSDMVDAILEGYPKSKKALIEDIGLETDEAVGFNIKV